MTLSFARRSIASDWLNGEIQRERMERGLYLIERKRVGLASAVLVEGKTK